MKHGPAAATTGESKVSAKNAAGGVPGVTLKYFKWRFFMDANDYFKRGKEYLEKEDYSRANEEFWKAQAMIFEPDKVELLREQSKDFDPEVVALSSMELLRQALGLTE